MTKRILFQNLDGGISVITPSGELSVEETAKKDVPSGVKYKIIDASDMLGSLILQQILME